MAKKDKGKAKKQKVMKQKVKKSTKKTFHEIHAAVTSTKIHLLAAAPQDLSGKTIKLDLTKNLRGKSLELKLRIKHANDKLTAEPEELTLAVSYIKRVMRKSSDYSEDSFQAETKDHTVTIKPLMVTRKRVSRSILKALRQTARKFLISHLKTRAASEIFNEIMTNKLQKQLAMKLKKIYPLALCEIRMFTLGKPLEAKPATKEKPAKETKDKSDAKKE